MQYQFDPKTVVVLAFFALHCGGAVMEESRDGTSNGTSFGGTSASPGTTQATLATQVTLPSTSPTNGTTNSVGGVGGRGGSGGTSGPASSTAAIAGPTIPPAPACTPSLNLLGGNLGPNGNWIGGEASSSIDNPCGVQGLIYTFGDAGPDNVAGTADDTCPFLDPAVSPCKDGRCCVSGMTKMWPPTNSIPDYDYNAPIWGCGIGISLNDPGLGSGTSPYNGPAKKFKIALSGSTLGQEVRVGYTQVATVSKTPFKEFYGLEKVTVGFRDVECPVWNNYSYEGCIDPGIHPHALQVWIAGGDVTGPFELCIEGLYPVL